MIIYSYFMAVCGIVQIITQLSICGVIVYFLLCHESLNYWPVNKFDYWLALYHGLVSRFAVKNTKELIDMRDKDACTDCFIESAQEN